MTEPDNKRERILKAAAGVFAKNGFFHSRISDIAKQAKVAEGTIYLYFKNKDDVLISLFEDEMAAIIKNMRDVLVTIDDTEGKIRKFIEKHLSLIDENRELAEVMQIELRQSYKFMKKYAGTKFRDYLNIISSIIQEGQQKGDIRPEIIPGVAKRVLFGALDEMSNYWVLSKNKKYSLEATAKIIGDIFIQGIK